MANTYLVKKDPAIPCSDENWMIMSYEEYKEWAKTSEGMSRKVVFGKILRVDKSDDIIYIECDEENKKKCQSAIDKLLYRKKVKNKLGYQFVSYCVVGYAQDEFREELIPDMETDVEEETIRKIDIEHLNAAIETLTKEEKELVVSMFLKETPLTGREYAKKIGITHAAVNYRRKAVLSKLRKALSSAEKNFSKTKKFP